MTPSGHTTIVVDRGNAPHDGKAGDPGALRLFRFNNGVHEPLAVIAPDGSTAEGLFDTEGEVVARSDRRPPLRPQACRSVDG